MRDRNEMQAFLRILSLTLVAIATAWFVVFSFLSQVTISGHSMEPKLTAGDLVLVDTLSYHFMDPKRMDVVVFRRGDGTDNVKRVIGLPGEIVVIQNGRIYINGTLLDSPEVSDIALPGIAEKPIELGENEYFLLGDNTDSSEDSRFENVGNVRRTQITGKVWFRLFPLKKLGLI